MSNIILQAENLHFAYQNKGEILSILKGADITVRRGESIAVVGSSGTGKSTLLHVLAGLDIPQLGTITMCGHNITEASDAQRTHLRNRYMGFVYQFHHLLPEFTSAENVAMPLLIRGESSRKSKRLAEALLVAVGLGERCDHRPSELSGGERQRVAIARALVNRPACLLADEPTGNLDQENAAMAFRLMKYLVAKQDGALIIVTHDMNLAAQMDRRFYLNGGILSEDKPNIEH